MSYPSPYSIPLPGGIPQPAGPFSFMPSQGGLGTLTGGANGLLGRGAPSLGQAAFQSNPLGGQVAGRGLAGMVPAGAGGQALEAANALRGAGGMAGQAAGVGRLGSIGSAASSIPGAIRGAGVRGVASKAFLPMTAAWGADALVDNLNPGGNNSNYEQALQGAAWGAGAGATIGSIVPGIGTGIGAAVGGVAGGAIGVLGNMFGGGGDSEQEVDPIDIINNAVNTAGLDEGARAEITTTYSTLMALAQQYPEGSPEREAAEQQAIDGAGQMVLQFLGQKEQAGMQASNTLALQAQAGQIFEPLAADIEQSGQMYAQAMAGIRDQLPESYRAISDATVARELTSSQKLANAYRAQAAITPIADRLTQYQQDQQSYAAQQFSQMYAQQAAGQQGGGQVSSDVLASLGA